MSPASPKKRHRVNIDVDPGFEAKLRLLAAIWGIKTNSAIQRAVDLAIEQKSSETDRALLKTISARTEEILHLVQSA